ncbi:hypothetical protein NHX12_028269 [Muraenolepis orangiensis]|uniref:Uncharacterized protein n=1 Tax=Muraenolepis orangiensis TaxID=630683 RepID=A0A9Q0EBH7_9TELE|nr:hypothetical protein NHX12_028269 [Muraenolepis orangiensis]
MKVGISERITGEAAGEAKPQSANNYERAEGPRPASEEVAGAMEPESVKVKGAPREGALFAVFITVGLVVVLF